jgi:hypothetical protein
MDEVAVSLWRGAFDGRLAYGTDPIITLKEPDMSNAEMQREAYTSALVRLRTADLFPLVQPGQALFPLMAVSEGRYCSMGGGAPLTSEHAVGPLEPAWARRASFRLGQWRSHGMGAPSPTLQRYFLSAPSPL